MPRGQSKKCLNMAESQMQEFRVCAKCKRQFLIKNKKLCKKLLIKHMELEHGDKNFVPCEIVCINPFDRDYKDISNNPSNKDVDKLSLW